MILFKVSAPGKIILYGDSLAMYERTVVAASLDLRTKLEFYELPDQIESIIQLQFPDVNLSLVVPLKLVLNFFFGYNKVDVKDNVKLLKHVQYFITANGMWTTYEQRFSLQTFFFLFINMIPYENLQIKSFRVHLTTELPIGAGLGSSSSFAVCIAACFLQWGHLQKGVVREFNDIDLEMISEYVKNCEETVQNYVIQADNDVCSFGQVVRYYYNHKQKGIQILDVPRLRVVLIDSKVSVNKREQMQQMMTLNCNISNILNRLHDISNQACVKLSRMNDVMNAYQLRYTFEVLKIFILLNQHFLSCLGMSHPRLDRICTIAKMHGFAGKLTNFGGRYAYALLSPDTSRENFLNFILSLIMESFTVRIANVSCSGVRIDG